MSTKFSLLLIRDSLYSILVARDKRCQLNILQGRDFSILVEKTYFFCQMTKPKKILTIGGKKLSSQKIVGLDFDM